MPRLIIAPSGLRGMERCRRFLMTKSPQAARRAMAAIQKQLRTLETAPEIGRPDPGDPAFRELIIAFGASGYVARYRYEQRLDAVIVTAFRHQREAGY